MIKPSLFAHDDSSRDKCHSPPFLFFRLALGCLLKQSIRETRPSKDPGYRHGYQRKHNGDRIKRVCLQADLRLFFVHEQMTFPRRLISPLFPDSVIRLIQQFLKENNLLNSLAALQARRMKCLLYAALNYHVSTHLMIYYCFASLTGGNHCSFEHRRQRGGILNRNFARTLGQCPQDSCPTENLGQKTHGLVRAGKLIPKDCNGETNRNLTSVSLTHQFVNISS